jgi:T-complex protein 1 subunit gamma
MLKMLLDPMGGIVLTNDGNAILREIDVSHPAAKSMVEISRTQDEEVGDGTTSVIILGMRNPFFSVQEAHLFCGHDRYGPAHYSVGACSCLIREGSGGLVCYCF